MASDELAAAGEWARNAANGGSVAVVEPKHIASPEPAMSSAQRNKDRREKQRARAEAPTMASDELAAAGEWARNAADAPVVKSSSAAVVDPMSSAHKTKLRRETLRPKSPASLWLGPESPGGWEPAWCKKHYKEEEGESDDVRTRVLRDVEEVSSSTAASTAVARSAVVSSAAACNADPNTTPGTNTTPGSSAECRSKQPLRQGSAAAAAATQDLFDMVN